MGVKVEVRDGESVQEAYRRLQKRISRSCPHEYWRWRWWGAMRYAKPSVRRRRQGWNHYP